MKGIGSEKVVWKTFLTKMAMFSHMVQMPKGLPANSRIPRDIVLDDDAFRQFAYYCYLEKYGKAARKRAKKSGEPFSYAVLASEVDGRKMAQKDPAYRMPTRNEIRTWGRRVVWNLLYWKNGPLGVVYTPDPFESYDGLPYYGYEIDAETQQPRMAGYVSARQKPVDEVMAQYLFCNTDRLGKRLRDVEGEDGAEKVAQKQRRVITDFAE